MRLVKRLLYKCWSCERHFSIKKKFGKTICIHRGSTDTSPIGESETYEQ